MITKNIKQHKKKKKQIPVQKLSTREKNNIYQKILWTAGLTLLMTVGILKILADTWGSLKPSSFLSFLAAVAAIAVGAVALFLKEKYRYASLLLLVPWPVFMFLTGINGAWDGARNWLNVLIARWNVIHDGGAALFSVQATESSAGAFSAMMILATVELLWIFIEGHHMIAINIIFLFWILLQLIISGLDPLGCGLLAAGLAGLWITDKIARITWRQIAWTAGILGVFCVLAYMVPETEILSISDMRGSVQKEIRKLRYGEETLPEGNLYLTSELKSEDKEMLKLQTEQQKTIYLRGFVGADYEDGIWKPLVDAAYGGTHSGMLNWLENNGFDPLNQIAEYYDCSDDENIPDTNRLKVQVTGASRYYVYVPTSTSRILKGRFCEEKDSRLFSKGIIGEKKYEVEEISGSRPSELTVADDWVNKGESDEQQKYIEAESVYRSFVYDNYRSVDKETTDLMNRLFWDDYQSDSDGIYSAVSQVRKILRKQVSYSEQQEDIPEGEDPVRWFLTEARHGNAMLYASAAVEALRVHGIPTRYVEGYYVSATELEKNKGSELSLTGKDTHAWAEVYFDGVGWLPVDVTPGYYYDAVSLQKMVSSPDVIQKNAILQDNSFGAEEVTGLENQHKEGGRSGKGLPVRSIAAICLGIVAVLIILIVFGLITCEIIRGLCIWHSEKAYRAAGSEQKIWRIQRTIYNWMGLVGIEAHLGWNTAETDRILTEKFPKVESGEYSRVCELIEKALSGGVELEAYEVRTLNSFFEKLIEIGKHGSLRNKILLRYAFAWKNRK